MMSNSVKNLPVQESESKSENLLELKKRKARKKMPRLLKIFLILLIVAGVVAGGLFIARNIISSNQTTNTIYTVTTEKYENAIEISGVVSAAQSQTLQALSAGTVTAVYVKQGDVVKNSA